MNVLVIYLSAYNGLSSSSKRMLGMVKGLVDNGYSVTIVTIDNGYNICDTIEYGFLKKVSIIPVSYEPNASFSSNNKSLKSKIISCIARLYRMIFIYGHSSIIANSLKIDILPCKSFDYVISVSDPKTSHLALNKLLKQGLRCNSVIEYWGDPLYGDITLKSIYPSQVLKIREKKMLSLADKIVYTSPFTLEEEKKIYREISEKMIFVPTAGISNYQLEKARKKDSYLIGYYGAYYKDTRNIMPLYESMICMDNLSVHLNIVGDTDISLSSNKNVTVLNRMDTKELESITDIFVCILNIRGTQIPGKVYYMAKTNKPIIVIVDGDEKEQMVEFLKGFNRFYICNNDRNEIFKTISTVVSEYGDKDWSSPQQLIEANIANQILGI